MRIEHYEFGRIRIDGREEHADLLLTPTRVLPGWWRRGGHVLALQDLAAVLEEPPRHYEEHDTEIGTYVVARVAAGYVGGMMSQPPEQVASGVPPSWKIFVGSDHLQTTLTKARELGGSVLQSPTSIPGGARVAAIADPAGAALALVQSPPSEHRMVRGEPGSVSWVECLSRDAAVSRRFYRDLLGWRSEEDAAGYVVSDLDGERVGGLMAMPTSVPAEVPSYWLVYFTIADVGEACTRAVEVGGVVLEPAHDIEQGRFAVLEHPAGAVFAVFDESTA